MAGFQRETIHIQNLQVDCIIGIHPHERVKPQPLIINAEIGADFTRAAESDHISDALNYHEIAETIREFVSVSSFQLLETLIRKLAEHLQERHTLPHLALHIRKPQAIPGSDGAAVSLELSKGGGRV